MSPAGSPDRFIVAMTGASGAVYGLRALRMLRGVASVESHLVASPSALVTLKQETGLGREGLAEQADVVHSVGNIGASIASGSFPVRGMLIAPCSIKTLSAVANSYSDNLITRAADVTLKEGRPLVLLVRETPLHVGHLRLMLSAAEAGAVIAPPVPAFYAKPRDIDDLVEHTVARALVRLGLTHELVARPWDGLRQDNDNRASSERG
jgi:4-hydroxy-3-polyprenylbenzoate decarboxylase